MHNNYYETQLAIRSLMGKTPMKKVFRSEPRNMLGDAFTYVERFVLALRNSSKAFNLIVESITPTTPHLDLLVESFAFSFFEDLMNPENSEVELLKVIKELAKNEYHRRTHITTMFEEGSSSVLSKMLMFYTKRRSQMKYLKLLFKKPLSKLAMCSEAWVLDPKEIFQSMSRSVRITDHGESRSRRSKRPFFSIFHHERSVSPQPEIQEEAVDYFEDSRVRNRVAAVTGQIVEHCVSILDSIYGNVKAMPTGVRWVCKTLNDLLPPGTSEEARNVMLGTFLFMKWWMPAIMRSEENGLLQDANSAAFIKNLPLIGNVLKKVFRQETFDQPQFRGINEFIASQM